MRASKFFEMLNRRRTVREYSSCDVPLELIEKAIATARNRAVGCKQLTQACTFTLISLDFP